MNDSYTITVRARVPRFENIQSVRTRIIEREKAKAEAKRIVAEIMTGLARAGHDVSQIGIEFYDAPAPAPAPAEKTSP